MNFYIKIFDDINDGRMIEVRIHGSFLITFKISQEMITIYRGADQCGM